MKKYKILLIDNDNTLMDFCKCSYNALSQLLDYPSDMDAKFEKFYHYTNLLWFAYEKKEIDKQELIKQRMDILIEHCGYSGSDMYVYTDLLTEQIELFPKVKETIEALGKNHQLCVITNGLANMQQYRLKKAELFQYFTHVFVSDEVGYHKPQAEYFEYVMKKLGCNREDMLIIGDSITADIAGGQNAGVDTCWISYGKQYDGLVQPNYIVNNFNDVLSIIDKN